MDHANRGRPKVSMTLSAESLEWLDAKCGPSRLFPTRSDAVDWCIKHLRQETQTAQHLMIIARLREVLDNYLPSPESRDPSEFPATPLK